MLAAPFGFRFAIASFGQLTFWEEDCRFLARLIIRARVMELEDVPQFTVLTDGEGFQGLSWTIQCEVLQQHLLGGLPADEDLVLRRQSGQWNYAI